MDGLDLVVRRPLKPMTNAEVAAIDSWPKALEAAARASGMQDKSLAIETGNDPALLSRMLSGQAGWTGDKLDRFMDACGSELPLMWLAHRRGYDIEAMRQRETELQKRIRQLEEQLKEERNEKAIITRFVREARAA